jgi:diadenosine tetraphosphate (Ap4A) HIT family hydrolase
MQQGSTSSTNGPGTFQPGCAFCEGEALATNILKETPLFRIVADHAPLVGGHLLIMPIKHYTCYGDLPESYDMELQVLKDEIKRFFAQYYQPIVYWEHGIFHQSVFHAHLHCFPFGDIRYNSEQHLHELLIQNQGEIRAWHRAHGHYFYLEDAQNAALFAPRSDVYTRIVQEVLWPGVVAQGPVPRWRSAQQRQKEGEPLIAELRTRWQQFQQQEEKYVDTTSER